MSSRKLTQRCCDGDLQHRNKKKYIYLLWTEIEIWRVGAFIVGSGAFKLEVNENKQIVHGPGGVAQSLYTLFYQ